MIQPVISVCIPAYKKPQYVVRCLESILKQTYKQVEVIISDDSPDEDIKHAIQPYVNKLEIKYFHNIPAFQSPKNWNIALDRGSGEYLLLMHQDDWFHSPTALSEFTTALQQYKVDFVFCRNTAVGESGTETILQAIPELLTDMARKPNHLLRAQVIGPPSNTILKRSVNIRYDEKFIWLVDVDYYSRILKAGYKYHYIDRHLVSIGLHHDQATEFCRANSDIIFRENIWFAAKLEKDAFKDILLYDYFWRLIRNGNIRSTKDIVNNKVVEKDIPEVIIHMTKYQIKFPVTVLRIGLVSKFLMSVNYMQWKFKTN
jgi:glycosyltransferase involved in cell wall biosynthesis